MKYVLGITFFALLIGGVIAWDTAIYGECRTHGFSVFYCFRQMGR